MLHSAGRSIAPDQFHILRLFEITVEEEERCSLALHVDGSRHIHPEPELIDTNSGVGSTVLATDLNKDGSMDVVTGTKLGTFIFWGQKHSEK